MIFEVDAGPSLIEMIFRMAVGIRYTDPPFICFNLFFAFWVFLLIRFRSSLLISSIMFFVSIISVYWTETINLYLIDNWQKLKFSTNYFDLNCIYLFVFWAIPFSIVAVFITFQLFLDLCKSIAVHRYFNSILRKNPEATGKVKTE